MGAFRLVPTLVLVLFPTIVFGDWLTEFRNASAIVKDQYFATLWKGIDWDARAEQAEKDITVASQTQDEVALFWALRKFMFIGDGHEFLSDPNKVYEKSIAGGFGLRATHDDQKRLIVVSVEASAAACGVKWGAEMLTWDGIPISAALAAIPPWRFYLSAPTTEGQQRQREMLITRAPVGSTVWATFRNEDGGEVKARLQALADGWRPVVLQMEYNWPFGGPISPEMPGTWPGSGGEYDGPSHGTQWLVLTVPNIGYFKLMTEDTLDAPRFVSSARAAVERFNTMKVNGVVIDLRGNNGGDDQPSADFVSLFYTGKENISYPYEDLKVGTIKPNSKAFSGNVAVLANHLCVSSCEGVSYALRAYLPNRTRYFSLDETTLGAFGSINDIDVKMPGGMKVQQLMVKDGKPMVGRKFKIEADGNGRGGVPADVVITPTVDNLRRLYRFGADLALEAAIGWLNEAAAERPLEQLIL